MKCKSILFHTFIQLDD
eukprot:UN16493